MALKGFFLKHVSRFSLLTIEAYRLSLEELFKRFSDIAYFEDFIEMISTNKKNRGKKLYRSTTPTRLFKTFQKENWKRVYNYR